MVEKNSRMTTVQQPQGLYQNRRTERSGRESSEKKRRLDKLSDISELLEKNYQWTLTNLMDKTEPY